MFSIPSTKLHQTISATGDHIVTALRSPKRRPEIAMRLFVRRVSTLLLSAALLQLAGCGRSPESDAELDASGSQQTLTGAGSTFAAPIIQKWIAEYRGENADVDISYAVVGSGEGIDRFLAGTVDFGATDAPLTPDDVARLEGNVIQIPVTAGMIAVTYNLPGLQGPLNLPRDVYPDIFGNRIFRWDDPRIAAANPGVALPSKLIQVVARLDGSGTTFAFTNHLSAIDPDWAKTIGVGKKVDWPGGAMEARGNEGVAQRIKLTEGSIGYVEAGFAQRLRMPLAWLENQAGGFVAPAVETGQRALVGGSDAIPEALDVMITDPEGARSYPIVTYTWLLLRKQDDDPAKTKAIEAIASWILTDGQGFAEALWYVPLPDNVRQAALKELDKLGNRANASMLLHDATSPSSRLAFKND
jgi:phosphate transport system substrate-binding protein